MKTRGALKKEVKNDPFSGIMGAVRGGEGKARVARRQTEKVKSGQSDSSLKQSDSGLKLRSETVGWQAEGEIEAAHLSNHTHANRPRELKWALRKQPAD